MTRAKIDSIEAGPRKVAASARREIERREAVEEVRPVEHAPALRFEAVVEPAAGQRPVGGVPGAPSVPSKTIEVSCAPAASAAAQNSSAAPIDRARTSWRGLPGEADVDAVVLQIVAGS